MIRHALLGLAATAGLVLQDHRVGFDYRFERALVRVSALFPQVQQAPFTYDSGTYFSCCTPVFRWACPSWLNVNSVSTRGSYGLFIDNWKPANLPSSLWTLDFGWFVLLLVISLFVLPRTISYLATAEYVDVRNGHLSISSVFFIAWFQLYPFYSMDQFFPVKDTY